MKLFSTTTEIIKHPLVQRLCRISQLGAMPHVFKVCDYSRLAHSIGVARKSKLLATHVAHNSGIEIGQHELLWIEIAGLLHDVGHGPWSHAFDKAVQKYFKGNNENVIQVHEERSQIIAKYILEQYP